MNGFFFKSEADAFQMLYEHGSPLTEEQLQKLEKDMWHGNQAGPSPEPIRFPAPHQLQPVPFSCPYQYHAVAI